MSTKRREGCATTLQNSHFTTVLDVRRARSDERVVSRLDRPNPPWVKKERNFKEVLIHNHSQQIFSADFFSRSSQQIFSADFLQQIFSADLLSRFSLSRSSQQIFFSRFSQQIFAADFLSADFLSRSSQQIFSADLLSRFSQQIFSADFLSRFSQQIFSLSDHLLRSGVVICCGQGLVVSYCLIICCGLSADLLSRSSQQIFSADCLHQIFSADGLRGFSGQQIVLFAVVRGYHLLWSGVGGQLLSYHLLWSGVGGQLLSYHVGGLYCMSSLEGPFRGAFGKNSSPGAI